MNLSGTIRKVISEKIIQIRGNNLKAKSSRSVITLGAGMMAGHGMKFVRRMILARVLAPGEIGIMAIVVSLSIAFEALTEVGVKQSIIQNKCGADTNYLNVAWWMQAIRGLGIFIIATLATGHISSFYDKPELLNLLRVAFFAILFRGFISPRAYVLEKEYKFGRAVLLTQSSAVLGAIITIILALVIRNVWALVAGFVAETAILCLLSYILVPFLPRFRIDRKSLSELMKFARGMFGLPILAMISFQAPVLVLGKVIAEEQLGLYSYAALLAYFPIELYAKIIGPVLLPAFSEKQDDKNALRRGVLQITRWTAVGGMPLIAFMICCGSELLSLVYSPQYTTMAIVFAVLCLQIMTRTQGGILVSMYFAVGQPHLHRRFAIVRAAVIIGLIYPAAVRFGALGAVAVIIAANFILLLMQVFWCRKVIDLEFNYYMRSYIPGLLLALPVIVIVGLLRLLGIDSAVLILIAGALTLLIAYAAYFGSIFVSKRHEDSFATMKELI